MHMGYWIHYTGYVTDIQRWWWYRSLRWHINHQHDPHTIGYNAYKLDYHAALLTTLAASGNAVYRKRLGRFVSFKLRVTDHEKCYERGRKMDQHQN